MTEGTDSARLERDDGEPAEINKARQALRGWHRTSRPPKRSTVGARGPATGEVLKRFPNAVSKDQLRTPHLTFDVRGGPLAGRPLHGGVRPARPSKEMAGTRHRHRRKRLALCDRGATLAGGDFKHLVFQVGPTRQCNFLPSADQARRPRPCRNPSPSTGRRELASSWLFEAMPDRTCSAGSDRLKAVTKLA